MEIKQRAGSHLFTGARFSLNQNRRPLRRQAFELRAQLNDTRRPPNKAGRQILGVPIIKLHWNTSAKTVPVFSLFGENFIGPAAPRTLAVYSVPAESGAPTPLPPPVTVRCRPARGTSPDRPIVPQLPLIHTPGASLPHPGPHWFAPGMPPPERRKPRSKSV